MSVEYGVITNGMSEKQLVAAISKLLDEFFRGKKENIQYDVYKNHKLRKHKYRGGMSYNPDKIEWDYEYSYDYFNKPYGVFVELYPNTNDVGESKFKTDGVVWNMYINDVFWGIRPENYKHPALTTFLPFILENIPCETVLIKEYVQGEDRL